MRAALHAAKIGAVRVRLHAAQAPLPPAVRELSYMSALDSCMTEPHSHDGIEIIGCFAGRVRVDISRRPLPSNGGAQDAGAGLEDVCIVPGGSLIVFNCRFAHRVSVLSPPYGRWLIHIVDDGSLLGLGELPRVSFFSPAGMSKSARMRFQLLFQRLFAAVSSARPREAAWASQQLAFLLGLAGEILGTPDKAQPKGLSEPSTVVSDVIAAIHRAMHVGVTVEELARRVSYSTAHLQRMFQAEMGLSISEYVAMQRLEQAGRLLMGVDRRMHVGAIADALGFSDVAYFSRYFRRHAGLSPLQYRDRLLEPGA